MLLLGFTILLGSFDLVGEEDESLNIAFYMRVNPNFYCKVNHPILGQHKNGYYANGEVDCRFDVVLRSSCVRLKKMIIFILGR